jgi:hypothetical protein
MIPVENPYDVDFNGGEFTYVDGEHDGFIEGSQAGIKAALIWGKGQCTEHPFNALHRQYYHQHRFDCPACMEQVLKEYGV